MDRQAAALKLARMGIIVQPAVRLGKYPLSREWQNAEPMSAADLHATWDGPAPPNVSALTGERSGIFVVDIDGERGRISMGHLVGRHGDLPATYTVRTPGGVHLYFQYPEGATIRNSVSKIAPMIDIRGDGGHVIAESSQATTKDGSIGDYVGNDLPLAEPPAWLVSLAEQTSASAPGPGEHELLTAVEYTRMPPPMQEAARAYVERALEGERELLRNSAQMGMEDRDPYGRGWEKIQADAARRLISLARAPWNPLTLEEAQRAFVESAPTDVGWSEQRVAEKWAAELRKAGPAAMPTNLGQRGSIFTDPPTRAVEPAPTQWQPQTWDDIGNARRIEQLFRHSLRYVTDLEKWALYRDGRWDLSRHAGERAGREMVERLEHLEADAYQNDTRDAFIKWAKRQRVTARVSAAAKMAIFGGTLDASSHDFDADPMLFNVANGTVDLRTGALLQHDPAHLIRQQSAVTYDPGAAAPLWRKFLERVMPDEEMRDYLQRLVGYSLTALTSEQVLFLHHGVTHNGKSVFLNVIEAAMGTYNQTVPPTTLLAKRIEQHPTDVARMEGKRMLQLAEIAENAWLDEALVKRMSGGDTVTARGMGEDFRDFSIVGKVHVVTNHLPRIREDAATWRRIRTVRWGVQIPEGERDQNLAARIIANELPGVLNWAVEGCLSWQRRGLDAPQVAQLDVEAYRQSEDVFGQFVESRLEKGDGFTPTEQICATYNAWCDAYGITQRLHPVALGRKLSERGFERHHTGKERGWRLRVTPSMGGAEV